MAVVQSRTSRVWNRNDTDVTDWKFVDFHEVPDGPWAKLGDNNTFVINKRLSDLRMAGLDSGKSAPQ